MRASGTKRAQTISLLKPLVGAGQPWLGSGVAGPPSLGSGAASTAATTAEQRGVLAATVTARGAHWEERWADPRPERALIDPTDLLANLVTGRRSTLGQ